MEAAQVRTIGDLRLFVLELIKVQEDRYMGSLEEYLRSLLIMMKAHRYSPVSCALVATFLEESFTTEPVQFDDSWLRYTGPCEDPDGSFDCLEHTLLFQIADLRRMEGKELEDKWRSLGLKSSTENDWYNFDPFTYLECATAGLESHVGEEETRCDWWMLEQLLELGRIYE